MAPLDPRPAGLWSGHPPLAVVRMTRGDHAFPIASDPDDGNFCHGQQLGLRNQPDSCWPGGGSNHPRPSLTSLPDHLLHLPRHQPRRQPVCPQGTGQHLHPHHESHPGGGGGKARRPRGRGGCAAGVERPGGGNHRPTEHRRGRRSHRLQSLPLRRHLQPVPLHPAQAGHHGVLRGQSR